MTPGLQVTRFSQALAGLGAMIGFFSYFFSFISTEYYENKHTQNQQHSAPYAVVAPPGNLRERAGFSPEIRRRKGRVDQFVGPGRGSRTAYGPDHRQAEDPARNGTISRKCTRRKISVRRGASPPRRPVRRSAPQRLPARWRGARKRPSGKPPRREAQCRRASPGNI